MQNTMKTLLAGAAAAVVTASMLLAGLSGTQKVEASSHREAPLISLDGTADNTDLYAFVSPDAPNTVTMIANYIPLEEPASGPNFFKFDDNVLYQIRVDNNGDARVDLVLEFRFTTTVANGDTFLYNTGTVTSNSSPNLNVKQTYSVTARVRQGDPNTPTFTTFVLGSNLPTPPVNVGPRSTPNYETALAEPSISNINGIKIFAGQRDEGFYSDLGSIFSLLGLRPLNGAHAIPQPASNGVDATAGYNVHSIAIQVPTQLLTANGQLPTGTTDPNAVIGVYATASRPSTRVLNTNGTATTTGSCANGQGIPGADPTCVQVSRIGNPLVNELFDPIGTSQTTAENDKDLYNAQLPGTDGVAQVGGLSRRDYIQGTAARPVEPVNLINLLYSSAIKPAPTSGRVDLVRVFLTGVPGLNRPSGPLAVVDPQDTAAGPGAVASDLMRLNTAIPAVAPGASGYSRLGVLGNDLSGYPNGRRVGDDIPDITARAAAGVLLPGNACSNGTQSCNQAPNNALGDGVTQNDKPFRTTFPYLATPWGGYDNPYHGRECQNGMSVDAPCPNPSPTPRP